MKPQLILEVAAGLRDLATKNRIAQPDDLDEIADILSELVYDDHDDPPPGPPFGDAVRPAPGTVEAMESMLLRHGGWVRTREIIQRLGLDKRGVCAAASESRVISSTSGGYRHIYTAEPGEFRHAMAVLKARADAQFSRRRWNLWVRQNENVFKK